jgi:hypothetical protein
MIFHLPGRMCTYLLAISVLEKFGLDPKTTPLKPMSVEQCVSEGLRYLLKNRPNDCSWAPAFVWPSEPVPRLVNVRVGRIFRVPEDFEQLPSC